jgi:hypothetical protein
MDEVDQADREAAQPISASSLLHLEEKQRGRFTSKEERISTGCLEVDESVLGGGGLDRGIVLGISAEGGEGRLVSESALYSCQEYFRGSCFSMICRPGKLSSPAESSLVGFLCRFIPGYPSCSLIILVLETFLVVAIFVHLEYICFPLHPISPLIITILVLWVSITDYQC